MADANSSAVCDAAFFQPRFSSNRSNSRYSSAASEAVACPPALARRLQRVTSSAITLRPRRYPSNARRSTSTDGKKYGDRFDFLIQDEKQLHRLALLLVIVRACAIAPIVRRLLQIFRQRNLVREIVIDDPFAPCKLEPVPVKPEARKESVVGPISRRSGIKSDPAVARKINFHPGVRVAFAHDVVAADVVEFAGKESAHVPRGNAERTQHHRHRRGEILAMSRAANEEEIGERVCLPRAAQIQCVGVARLQVPLDIRGLVVFILRAGQSHPAPIS